MAFDNSSMEWIVVACIRLDAQNSAGYALCFEKLFEKCKSSRTDFELGITLQKIVIDLFDAEIKGLRSAVGKEMADKLLKGCKVHWQRSCQHIAETVSLSQQREKEKGLFLKNCSKIQVLESSTSIIACFETLCNVQKVVQCLEVLPGLCDFEDAKFIDENCNWSAAKNWAQWWARCDHLNMLSKSFSVMTIDQWQACPSSTNAVERRNNNCKSDSLQCLKLSMMKVYKIDKLACLKHIAAKKGVTLSYRSKTEEARTAATNKQSQQLTKSIPDKTCQHGPPDCVDNFLSESSSRKQVIDSSERSSSSKLLKCICVSDSIVECIPNAHPEIIGKRAKMKFFDQKGQEQWYEGIISSYNVITGKYSVYFPYDRLTDMEIID